MLYLGEISAHSTLDMTRAWSQEIAASEERKIVMNLLVGDCRFAQTEALQEKDVVVMSGGTFAG